MAALLAMTQLSASAQEQKKENLTMYQKNY